VIIISSAVHKHTAAIISATTATTATASTVVSFMCFFWIVSFAARWCS
jgi:hypothetical protein